MPPEGEAPACSVQLFLIFQSPCRLDAWAGSVAFQQQDFPGMLQPPRTASAIPRYTAALALDPGPWMLFGPEYRINSGIAF